MSKDVAIGTENLETPPPPFGNGGVSINCGTHTHTSKGQTNTLDFVSGVAVHMCEFHPGKEAQSDWQQSPHI